MQDTYAVVPDAQLWAEDARNKHRPRPPVAHSAKPDEEKQRSKYARQNRWGADHLRTVSCRLTLAEDLRVQAACARIGRSRHWLLKRLLREWLREGGPML